MTELIGRAPSDYWLRLPAFYRELIELHGCKQQPMLDLVQDLAHGAWTQTVFPSTSHEALGLSRHEFHEARLTAPMVYVRYNGERDNFEIEYQLGQGHTVSTETAGLIDQAVRSRIMGWLAPEHSGAAYRGRAKKYAETVDSKPWNAHYERPALVSLLPALEGASVLDVGCGSGWYAEYLVKQGAQVTAFDLDADFVALTRARVPNGATVYQANLAEPLVFARDGQFDVVVCPLVLHYLKDWRPALAEFHRVLSPQGTLVFSTHHPFNDWKLFNRADYFAVELLEDEWDGFGKVMFYRRPLTVISSDLHSAGFVIEKLLEPQPTEAFGQLNPEGYERLRKNPWFLAIRAVKR